MLFYFRYLINQPASSVDSKKEIKISEGESSINIAGRLSSRGLVNSKWVFYVYLKLKEKVIQPGDYLMPTNLTIIQVADALGNKKYQVIKITIPEGWRREQIAQYLFEHAKISASDFLAATKELEGKIFPDTYDLTDEPTVDEVVEKMTENFDNRIAGMDLTSDKLILASIVEREAGSDAERADIAGVFINRLARGMKLEADPTVQYQKDTNNYPAVGISNFKFWQKLETGDSKKIQGVYNTYLNNGLPPAPICNPGLASIKAALNPSHHDYLYFFHDANGKIYFSTTQAEQTAKEKLYLK